jgi:hypothetical protein
MVRAKRMLGTWEELIGKMEIVSCDKDGVIVRVLNQTFILPNFPESLASKLQRNKAALIGILRTECGYALRVMHSQIHAQICPRRCRCGSS